MRAFFKYVSSGISFLLLYLFVVFLTPIILILFDYSYFSSNPTFLNYELYMIEIVDNNFISNATGFGSLISFLFGILIYFLFNISFKNRNR